MHTTSRAAPWAAVVALLVMALFSPAPAQDDLPRVGVRVLPFTGIAWWGGGGSPGRPGPPFLQAGAGGYQAEVDERGREVQFGGPGVSVGGGAELPLGHRFFLQAELRSN